jgi:uncharacterized protein (DUF1810 family)
MTDSFDLQRFVDAQAPVYSRVVEELRRGRKQSHWMWFVFPQIAGLGHSAMAQRFAISSTEEASRLDRSILRGCELRRRQAHLLDRLASHTRPAQTACSDAQHRRSSGPMHLCGWGRLLRAQRTRGRRC